jgi:Ca-activated chloride channel family protein
VPIKNIYSPSHKVGISRRGENQAVIGFEQEQSLLDRDFVLYYGVSRKDFGLNLLTHAVQGEDGFFMMMLSPAVMPRGSAVSRKDITFVCDTSGSMAGEKIDQARRALAYCVKKLNDGDRFNIVRFSTDVETFKDGLVEVTEKTRKEALGFVEDIEARGGTAIDAALGAALGMKYDKTRPNIIAFLTDGKPTIGESDTDVILGKIKQHEGTKPRIFVFGVGEKVNTHLLDKISGEHGGLSRYVKPGEDIEVKVSSFADKMSHPVLARLSIEVDKLKLLRMHPRELPDLFSGDQLTVLGRYRGQGHVAIRLLGEVNGKKREFVYEGDFPRQDNDNVFIPRLWATRRVGYLLDEIRLRGENEELQGEVTRLSREYGIMTPYTSYLVLEDDKAYKQHGIDRRNGTRPATAPGVAARMPAAAPLSRPAREVWAEQSVAGDSAGGARGAGEREEARGMVPVFGDADLSSVYAAGLKSGRTVELKMKSQAADEVDAYFKKESGADAVKLSEAIQRYKQRDRAGRDMATVRHVARKIFYLIDGRWVDGEYKQSMKTTRVTFASDEYFKLLADKPELKKFFALGEKVIVVLDNRTAIIVE